MPTKKTAKKKPVKKAVKRKPAVKKPKMICGVCGMEVIVDKICGCEEAHPVVCCGQAMDWK